MAKDARLGGEIRRQEPVSSSRDSEGFLSMDKANHVRLEPGYRKKKFPFRTGLAAVSLFTLGSLLIFVSTRIGLDGERRGLSFLILGLIAFIPGCYATVQLYGSYKGWKGYDYSQIPSYDD